MISFISLRTNLVTTTGIKRFNSCQLNRSFNRFNAIVPIKKEVVTERRFGNLKQEGNNFIKYFKFKNISLCRPFSSQTEKEEKFMVYGIPEEGRKKIGIWLLICCGMIFGMIVIGGVTRLTESGLSITEWKPITGTLPPMNESQWNEEFEKYKQSPEYIKLNFGMTIEEYKRIYFMEWLHRFMGRVIGIAFIGPLLYYSKKGWIRGKFLKICGGLAALGGLQGVIGWYMVKSGLEHQTFEVNNSVPRVSQYRLALHLTTAVALYSSLFTISLKLLAPSNHSILYSNPNVKLIQRLAIATTSLAFLTAFSGAFVAGLDAGLIYNTFPKMGEQWIPDEVLQMKPIYKNFFENDTTVQFDHRILGTATFTSVLSLYFYVLHKLQLPKSTKWAMNSLVGAVSLQFALGISTLLTFVPVPLAASHQAGAMTLLTTALWATRELKRIPIKNVK